MTFDDSPDYEAPADDGTNNIYNVNVIATDDAPAPLASAEYPVAINVTNVDEPGAVTLAPATAPKVGVEIIATLSDPDGGETNHAWQWESSPNGTDTWTATTSGGNTAAYTPVAGDTDNQLRATVSYTDTLGPNKTAMSAATVAVTENQPPPAPNIVPQIATAGTRFSYQFDAVTDPDGHTVTYSAILDDDNALPPWLRFNNATRTFSGTPQAGNEGAITVRVTVMDDGTPPKSDDATFTITVGAAAECTAVAIDQDDSTTPGDTVDLTLSFTQANCAPGALTSELTITLHEDIGVPDDFDKADVIIRAGGRFEPDWADYNEAEDGTHEIELPGCQAWGPSSQNALGVCDRSGLPISIQLEDIQLPSRPSENGEGYEITIQWDDGTLFTEIIDVTATLAIAGTGSDRDEVAYGETITFAGTGFGDNLTVRLYTRSGDAEVDCTDAGPSGWREIGTDDANDRGSFSIPIVVDSAFDSASAYQVCAVDGGGTRNDMSVSMLVKFGIEVTGDAGQEFTPGEDVRITLIGGGRISATNIDIYVRGRALADSEWDLRRDGLVVTLPPGVSGNVQISVFVNRGHPGAQRANANITVGSLELEVTGLRSSGLILGQSFLVQVDGLAGTEVRSVRLDGIELAFLQGGDIYGSREYPPVPSNGRFTGSVVAINRDGSLSDQLIRMARDSDGTEELEIEDSAGVVASTEVEVAIPTITIDPAEGSVPRGGEITITGQNFPIYHDDYNREEIEVWVNERREARIESSNGSWTQKVTIRRNMDSGTRLNIEVRTGDYSFRSLTRGFDLRVTPSELAVIPKELKIGNPFRYTVTGLEGFVRYTIMIDNRLEVVEFTTDGAGNQTGITVIPVNYHRDFATQSGRPATLQVNDSRGGNVAGVFFTVILQQEQFVPATPTPTNTPLPTNTPVPTDTPVPTNTPLPTDTPIPPTDTPVPPTDTPVPPTEPPTPFPTVTPEPTVDADEVRQTVVAQLQPTLDPDIRDRPARQSDTGAEQNQSIFGSATLVLSIGLAAVLALIIVLVVAVLILRRRAAA